MSRKFDLMCELVYHIYMEIITKKDYQVFLNKLKGLSAGSEYANFSKQSANTAKNVIGVRAKALRLFAKEISNNNHIGLYKYGNNDIFEEVLVKGFVIASYSDIEQAKQKLNELMPYFDSWAETDMICVGLRFVKRNPEESIKYFLSLLNSEKEFICRFGIVCLMKYFLINDYFERVIDALNVINCDKYYVNMAVAWLICEYLIKKPQNAIKNMQKIIKNSHFNSFIINKSIQKACESYRISGETKNQLREMKLK